MKTESDLPTYEVAIKATIDEQFLRDVLITAVETPFGSWWWVKEGSVVRDDDLNILSIDMAIDDPNEDEGSGKHTPWQTVTPAGLVQPIQEIVDGKMLGSTYMDYLMRGIREQDAGDIDAVVADAILQVFFLSEVVYG